MDSKMIIDRNNQLQELRETSHQPKNIVLQWMAKILSYVFHPLFVPVYIIWFLINTQSYIFAGFSTTDKLIALLRFFIMYCFFPLVTVLLSKALGFIDTIYLKTQKDRIIPYIACGIYYFWMAYVLRHQPEFSHEIVQLSMAIFISSSIGLLLNIYMKVSMHAIAMGIMVFFIGMLTFSESGHLSLYFSIALLIAGLVCTARLIVSDHTQAEIYTGLLAGIVSMLIAVWADGILP